MRSTSMSGGGWPVFKSHKGLDCQGQSGSGASRLLSCVSEASAATCIFGIQRWPLQPLLLQPVPPELLTSTGAADGQTALHGRQHAAVALSLAECTVSPTTLGDITQRVHIQLRWLNGSGGTEVAVSAPYDMETSHHAPGIS
jgi:hypothetical protein